MDSKIIAGLSMHIEYRDDAGIEAIQAAILGAISEDAMPGLALRDVLPHLLHKYCGMRARGQKMKFLT